MLLPVNSGQSELCLEENLASFISLLRQEGLPVGTTELFDALAALQKIDLGSRDAFYTALQVTLVKSRADRTVFRQLFDHFFIPGTERRKRDSESAHYKKHLEKKMSEACQELQFKGEQLMLSAEEMQQYSAMSQAERERLRSFVYKTERGNNVEPQFKPLLETVVKSHLRYCRSRDNEAKRQQDVASLQADGAGSSAGGSEDYLRELDIQAINEKDLPLAEQLLQRLSRKLAVKLLRRRRSGPRSGVIDLRRSMRDNMRFGGLIFNLKHRPKRRSRQQILLLCDVSASMKQYSSFVIHFLYGMREAVRDLACLTFSDHLDDLTAELKNKAGLKRLLDRVIRRSANWGGGTNLGAALSELRQQHPALLGPKTTVLVVSDTKTVALSEALRELELLKSRVKRVIWLNPLTLEQWSDYRSVEAVAAQVEMWPCSTIAQLEEVLAGRL